MVSHPKVERGGPKKGDNMIKDIDPALIEKTGLVIYRSGMFGTVNGEQAQLVALECLSEGITPLMWLRKYRIDNGQISQKADSMLSDFLATGGRVEWIESTNQICHATFTHQEKNPKGIEIKWDLVRAAPLMKSKNGAPKAVWANHPGQMLRARTITEGIRACTGQNYGLYDPDELSVDEKKTVEYKSVDKMNDDSWIDKVGTGKAAPAPTPEPAPALNPAPAPAQVPTSAPSPAPAPAPAQAQAVKEQATAAAPAPAVKETAPEADIPNPATPAQIQQFGKLIAGNDLAVNAYLIGLLKWIKPGQSYVNLSKNNMQKCISRATILVQQANEWFKRQGGTDGKAS